MIGEEVEVEMGGFGVEGLKAEEGVLEARLAVPLAIAMGFWDVNEDVF